MGRVVKNMQGKEPSPYCITLHTLNFISLKEKQHYVFIDMAYQGFSTGDLDRDALALRLFVEDGHKLSYAQSFSKNMGLYGKYLLNEITLLFIYASFVCFMCPFLLSTYPFI